MSRRQFILGSVALLAAPFAYAQKAPARIGLLWLGTPETPQFREAFLRGMGERGLRLGRDFEILDHSEVDRYENLANAAKVLVQAKVDVIVSFGATAPRAARRATATIPIAVVGVDPVAVGLAKSFGQPGGNVTGIATRSFDLIGKRFELLKECVPGLQRVALLLHAGSTAMDVVPEMRDEAARLKLQIHVAEMRAAEDLERAFAAAAGAGCGAMYVVPSTGLTAQRQRIATLALKHRLPAIAGNAEFAAAGLLLTYSADVAQLFRALAGPVARMLKGEPPGRIPIEQASEFVPAVNLKTAKALGLKIPEMVRLRATRIVE